MDKQRLSSFNKQLSRIYSLAIIHVIISVVGLLLNYVRLDSNYLYFAIITLNVVSLICFEPWKIVGYLNEGYGYKKGLETLAQERGVKHV